MEFKDYYQIMGLAEDASAEEVKRAYRKLARKYHPDVSKEKDAEHRFKEVGEAYEVLKDPEKRQDYDAIRRYHAAGGDARAEGGFRPPPDWRSRSGFPGGGYTEADPHAFSEFFESLFGRASHGGPGGGAGRAGGAAGFRGDGGRGHGFGGAEGFHLRGEDLHHRLPVTLEEAYHGGGRAIQLEIPRLDPSGRIHHEGKTLQFHIPAGVMDGQQIRLRGQGGPGVGEGPPGDLYLEIEILPHRRYTVSGRDITLILPVTPWEAALGAVVRCPTLGGSVQLTLPPGASSGQRMRLKGRGLPGRHEGDQYVVLQIQIPPATSEAAKAFYRRMAEELPFDPRAGLADGGGAK